MLAPGSGSLNNVKTTKANRVLNVGSLDTNVPPPRKYPNSQKFKLSSCNKMKEQKEFNKQLFRWINCVLKASVDRVSVDTIGRYSDRHSADRSTNTRLICRPSVGRHLVLVNRLLVDTIGRYVGRHSADISADMLRSTVASVSVDCR